MSSEVSKTTCKGSLRTTAPSRSSALVRFGELYREPSRNGVYKAKEHHGSGVRIVNMGELFAYDFIGPQEMNRLVMTDAEMKLSDLAEGDLLFGRRSLIEAGAGKCSIVTGLTEPATFESSIIRVRVDQQRVNPQFLFYWFKSPVGRGAIRAIVTGTNVKGIRGSDLQNIDIWCPDKDIQDRCASVLFAYDQLLANNCRRIKLLEDAARLLFREWFVYFRFPGHEHVKVSNGVPEGWQCVPLNDLCTDIREQVDPSKVTPETNYIGLEHIPRRSITLADWGQADNVTSMKFRFQTSDILFGKIRPYFHKVGFTLSDGITSSDAIVIRPVDEKFFAYSLCLLSSDGFVALASKTVREGSKMPRADWKFLQTQRFPLPPEQLRDDFNDVIMPIVAQLRVLALQNRRLTDVRNVLLPRLMSGEVEV